jgi:hypothetical protein
LTGPKNEAREGNLLQLPFDQMKDIGVQIPERIHHVVILQVAKSGRVEEASHITNISILQGSKRPAYRNFKNLNAYPAWFSPHRGLSNLNFNIFYRAKILQLYMRLP